MRYTVRSLIHLGRLNDQQELQVPKMEVRKNLIFGYFFCWGGGPVHKPYIQIKKR